MTFHCSATRHFERFELHDLEPDEGADPVHKFKLTEWPQNIHRFAFIAGYRTQRIHEAVRLAAQGVLDARAVHQKGQTPASLADLYNPTTMPANLSTAHKALDKAVDAAYGKRGLKTDVERVAYLFTLYDQYTSLLA